MWLLNDYADIQSQVRKSFLSFLSLNHNDSHSDSYQVLTAAAGELFIVIEIFMHAAWSISSKPHEPKPRVCEYVCVIVCVCWSPCNTDEQVQIWYLCIHTTCKHMLTHTSMYAY